MNDEQIEAALLRALADDFNSYKPSRKVGLPEVAINIPIAEGGDTFALSLMEVIISEGLSANLKSDSGTITIVLFGKETLDKMVDNGLKFNGSNDFGSPALRI